MSRRAVHLGVTGGIGSGKSTFAAMLQGCGAALVDADALARGVTLPGGAAIAPLRTAFGSEFIDASGALDRARMRALAFADAAARTRLEAIVHPLVSQAVDAAVEAAIRSHHRLVVLDIPLLTESSRWAARLDAVLVVDCPEEVQIARVQARSGLDVAAVRAIMATQSPRALRRSAADWLVFNDGLALEQLQTQARQVAAHFGL
ncbi:dephospho-CoA kinase [Oryzisolibacter propanilivorax]|uniref:Dephospho-CoA kinase n=1 Tax=Oryzisolibacter propanilivorax TaxID=1527607 RepID=A0A1G9UVD3_9BURK|nr:dephospho-CoA kinase [Oryzisolibacter propanilivorax]SDM63757.1 dephospho-CoA kinase [Oryzisolibacter propanilivorax]